MAEVQPAVIEQHGPVAAAGSIHHIARERPAAHLIRRLLHLQIRWSDANGGDTGEPARTVFIALGLEQPAAIERDVIGAIVLFGERADLRRWPIGAMDQRDEAPRLHVSMRGANVKAGRAQ